MLAGEMTPGERVRDLVREETRGMDGPALVRYFFDLFRAPATDRAEARK